MGQRRLRVQPMQRPQRWTNAGAGGRAAPTTTGQAQTEPHAEHSPLRAPLRHLATFPGSSGLGGRVDRIVSISVLCRECIRGVWREA